MCQKRTLVIVCKNEKNLRLFSLDVYGMTEEQYIGMFPFSEKDMGRQIIRELDNKVSFHGIVPNALVMDKIRHADFSILIRDKKSRTFTRPFVMKILKLVQDDAICTVANKKCLRNTL